MIGYEVKEGINYVKIPISCSISIETEQSGES